VRTPQGRARLIEAAAALFQEGGYPRVSIRDIARAVRLPKGTFYNYFDSKEHLASVVIGQQFAKLPTCLADSSSTSYVESARRHLQSVAQQHRDASVSPLRLIGTLAAEAPALPSALRIQVASGLEAWSRQLGEILAMGQAAGEMESSVDPHEFAGFLVNSLQGAVLRAKCDPSSGAMDAFIRFGFYRPLRVAEAAD